MPQIVCEITTLDLSYVVWVKSTLEISQNFAAFSEYMNFTSNLYCAIPLPLWSETTTKNGGHRKCFLVQYFYRPWDTFMEFVSKQKYVCTVQVFWKGHKNLTLLSKCQKRWEIFSNCVVWQNLHLKIFVHNDVQIQLFTCWNFFTKYLLPIEFLIASDYLIVLKVSDKNAFMFIINLVFLTKHC